MRPGPDPTDQSCIAYVAVNRDSTKQTRRVRSACKRTCAAIDRVGDSLFRRGLASLALYLAGVPSQTTACFLPGFAGSPRAVVAVPLYSALRSFCHASLSSCSTLDRSRGFTVPLGLKIAAAIQITQEISPLPNPEAPAKAEARRRHFEAEPKTATRKPWDERICSRRRPDFPRRSLRGCLAGDGIQGLVSRGLFHGNDLHSVSSTIAQS